MDRDAVIVGGGLAGLTAGALLARDGLAVTVIEGSGQLGGRARTTRKDGFHLNLGPHAVAMGGAGTTVLTDLGIDLPGGGPELHKLRLLVDGRLVRPIDRRAGGAGVRGLTALTALFNGVKRHDPDGTIAAHLATHTSDARVLGLLTAMARLTTYADALDEQAGDVFAGQARAAIPVRFVDGGWDTLVEQLREAAVAAGADVRRASRAVAVRRADDGRVAEVVLADGAVLPTGAVVLAVGGPGAAASLVDGVAAATLEGWAARARPLRMATLDVALRTRPAGMPPIVLGTDEPLFLTAQSDRSRIAPDGAAAIHVARFLPLGAHAPDGTRAQLEGLLDLAAPGWRDALVHARYLPDLVVTHDGGSVHTGGRRGRPGPAVPPAPGLYVAGDWVGPDGYLSQTSLLSAASAARAIRERAGAHREVNVA